MAPNIVPGSLIGGPILALYICLLGFLCSKLRLNFAKPLGKTWQTLKNQSGVGTVALLTGNIWNTKKHTLGCVKILRPLPAHKKTTSHFEFELVQPSFASFTQLPSFTQFHPVSPIPPQPPETSAWCPSFLDVPGATSCRSSGDNSLKMAESSKAACSRGRETPLPADGKGWKRYREFKWI